MRRHFTLCIRLVMEQVRVQLTLERQQQSSSYTAFCSNWTVKKLEMIPGDTGREKVAID